MYCVHGIRVRFPVVVAILLTGFVWSPLVHASPGERSDPAAVPFSSQPVASARIRLHQVGTGFSLPVLMTHAGDGSNRLFVVERGGIISILKNGSKQVPPFLNIDPQVNSSGGEQGLLGLAFHPSYESNGRFFVAYTAADNSLTLSRFEVSPGDPDVADPAETPLLSIPHPGCTNHNGGTLAFGPDGFLYWSTGDGGGTPGNCGGDPEDNAQDLSALLGKILRLDVDNPDAGLEYGIPVDNPFVSIDGHDLIWAYGLRNPWRLSFDRLTGDLFIGDVGQGAWEEIDHQPASDPGGSNYGWRFMEGSHCYNPSPGCDPTGTVLPVAEYSHSLGCSVTGGYIYRGARYETLLGHYFYGDFCSGRLFDLYYDDAVPGWLSSQLLDTSYGMSTFGEDERGEIYFTDYGNGRIYRVQYVENYYTDFDANGSTDLAIYRPSTGQWLTSGPLATWGGQPGDIPVPGDYDADGDTDVAVYRPSNGVWYVQGQFNSVWGGMAGDVPVAGDYDGDGKTDIAIFRPSNGTWYVKGIFNSGWGSAGDIPVPGDYDGDGRTDVAIFRPSTGVWYIKGRFNVTWGAVDDIPVAGDYDGDGRTDVAVFRPSTGVWYIRGQFNSVWGASTDVPVPGDYDANGTSDVAVWRPSTGIWYVKGLFNSTVGVPGDFPVPARDTNADGDPYQ